MLRVPLRWLIDQLAYFEGAVALYLVQILEVSALPIKSFQLKELKIFIQQIYFHLSKCFSA